VNVIIDEMTGNVVMFMKNSDRVIVINILANKMLNVECAYYYLKVGYYEENSKQEFW